MRQPVEPRMNVAERVAGLRRFTLEFRLALFVLVAAPFIAFATLGVFAAERIPFAAEPVPFTAAFFTLSAFVMSVVVLVTAFLTARAARTLVHEFVVVQGQCRLVVLFVIVRFDDVVEPLADRHAGAARGRARSLTRLGAQAS
jgi:hypothetical protein